MNESQLKKKFKERWPGLMINISERYKSGIPDSYCAYNGNSVWLEFKVDGHKPTKLQKYYLEKINEQCVYAGLMEYFNKSRLYCFTYKDSSYFCKNLDDLISTILEGIKC